MRRILLFALSLAVVAAGVLAMARADAELVGMSPDVIGTLVLALGLGGVVLLALDWAARGSGAVRGPQVARSHRLPSRRR